MTATPSSSPQQQIVAKWKLVRSETAFASRWLTIFKEEFDTPNGRMDDFFTKKERSWSCIFAVTPSNKIVMVRQYRPGVDEVCLEMPAGTLDDAVLHQKAEAPQEAALRELKEETGFVASHIDVIQLGCVASDPNRDKDRAYGFFVRLASEAPQVDQHLDTFEQIQVVLVSLEELKTMAMGGTNKDGLSILHGTQLGFIWRGIHTLEQQILKSTSPQM